MKINDGCGFSHLHEAVGQVVWSLHGLDASVPAEAKVLVICLDACKWCVWFLRELQPGGPWVVSYVWAKESCITNGRKQPCPPEGYGINILVS